MCPHIGTKSDADGQGHIVFCCTAKHIGNRKHDIIFLVNLRLIRKKVKITQIFFCRFQFYDHQNGFRCCPGKILLWYCLSCCYGSHPCTMTTDISYRYQVIRIFCHQCLINLFSGIFPSKGNSVRIFSRHILVPDTQYSGLIAIPEQRILIINARINYGDHSPRSPQFQIRMTVKSENPGSTETSQIHRDIAFGNR